MGAKRRGEATRLSDTAAIVAKGLRPQLSAVAWPGARYNMLSPQEFPASFARDASPDMDHPDISSVINKDSR